MKEKENRKDKKQNAPQEGALCRESLLIASGAGRPASRLAEAESPSGGHGQRTESDGYLPFNRTVK